MSQPETTEEAMARGCSYEFVPHIPSRDRKAQAVRICTRKPPDRWAGRKRLSLPEWKAEAFDNAAATLLTGWSPRSIAALRRVLVDRLTVKDAAHEAGMGLPTLKHKWFRFKRAAVSRV